MKRTWRNSLSALVLGSALIASSVAMAAPRGNGNGHGRGFASASRPAARSAPAAPAIRPARPAPAAHVSRPAPSFRNVRPVVVHVSRPAPVVRVARPHYGPARVVRVAVRPAHLNAHHHRYLARVRTLRASIYRFVHVGGYTLAAKLAELARIEAELVAIQANESWLASYGEYAELLRLATELRASLGVYAPPPPAALAYAF